jgi:L-alanine-DL-glutamate epimerase-like enolase superfamily enzyme
MRSIDRVEVAVYSVPLDAPESDGTMTWDRTTAVVVHVACEGVEGIGYTYGSPAVAKIIESHLAGELRGRDPLARTALHARMRHVLRNVGYEGPSAMAVSAVDVALWDLGGKLLGVPVGVLAGLARGEVPIYGSGGFCSLSLRELEEQLSGWQSQGIGRVKMKVGREPAFDLERVRAARAAIGDDCELFVDANGAYDAKGALAMAERFAEHGVSWFEEPVSSDDLGGLRLLRERAPAAMRIAAGEYGWTLAYFRRMLEERAVDVLQVDATRAGGITGFIQAASVADSFGIAVSSHCAPSIHLHASLGVPRFAHLEWFADHVRVESMLFEGTIDPVGGTLRPDLGRPGLGITLGAAAERFRM